MMVSNNERLAAVEEQLTNLRDNAKAEEAERRRQERELQDERAHLRSIDTYQQLVAEDPRLPELTVLLHTDRCTSHGCDLSYLVAQGSRDWHRYNWLVREARGWLQTMGRAAIDRNVAVDVKRAEVLSDLDPDDDGPLHNPDLLDPTVQLFPDRKATA